MHFSRSSSAHARQGRQRIGFPKDDRQLIKYPPTAHLFEKAHAHSTAQQEFRVPAKMKTEALLKSNRAKDPGRILDETQVVQNANGLILEIALTAEKIEQFPITRAIQGNSQGIDGKITAIKIMLNRGIFNSRQRARFQVIFNPGGGHVYLEPIGENNDRGAEFAVRADAAIMTAGIFGCQGNAVPFDNHIDIEILLPQQQITDKPADSKDMNAELIADCPQLSQDSR